MEDRWWAVTRFCCVARAYEANRTEQDVHYRLSEAYMETMTRANRYRDYLVGLGREGQLVSRMDDCNISHKTGMQQEAGMGGWETCAGCEEIARDK